MSHPSSKKTIAAALMSLALGNAASAAAGGRPITVRTPSLTPDPDGYVYCRVVASSRTPIGIVASIVTADGVNVTDFGTGFRASPEASGTGAYHAEETAGSFTDNAASCRATVTGAHRRDIELSLTVFDRNGAPLATVSGGVAP